MTAATGHKACAGRLTLFVDGAPCCASLDLVALQVELPPGTGDEVYLSKLQQALVAAAVMMPQPHLIIYNAGTDILAGDPLGRWGVQLSSHAAPNDSVLTNSVANGVKTLWQVDNAEPDKQHAP